MRAVLIDTAFLGDVVFNGPFVRAFKARHPEGELAMVVRPPADAVARRIVGVDRVHVFDKRGDDRGLFGFLRVAKALTAQRYDVAYVAHPSVRSTALVRQAGIPTRIGYTDGAVARRFLTKVRPSSPKDTFVKMRLRLLDADDASEDLAGTMVGAASAPAAGPRRVGLVLGSNWATKRWDPAQARAFVSKVDPAAHRLVLLGSGQERSLFDGLEGEDGLGGTVDALIDRIASLDLLIAGDTGPLHIARALGVPTIALFGPTPTERHSFGDRDRVLTVPLDCRPCSAHGGDVCPEGHHRCMKDLAGARVMGEVVQALEGR